MSVQETFVIVKPDGLAKGLVGEILRDLSSHDLLVTEHARTRLSRELVEELYSSERKEVYFGEVVDWVSSGTVLILKIRGEQAVDLVKWQIIGRYPNGIRGRHAENWIKNIAHAPDSVSSVERELRLLEHLLKENKMKNQSRFEGRTVFALTGMSECGKSTVGKYLDSRGVKRLKIVRLFERVIGKLFPGSTQPFYDLLRREEERDPYSLWDAFIDELFLEMEAIGAKDVSIESLYGGGLGPYLKRILGDSFCIVYVDIPLEIRLQRQMLREGLSSIKDAEEMLLPRDEVKTKSGISALREVADEVIDNSGTLEDLFGAVDAMIVRHCK